MDAAPEPLVWQAGLDSRYVVKVVRIKPYHGRLQIWEGDELLHDEPVGLSYDAIFGPDIGDVHQWQERALRVVDGMASG